MRAEGCGEEDAAIAVSRPLDPGWQTLVREAGARDWRLGRTAVEARRNVGYLWLIISYV